jgi:hypothetical protein
LEFDKDLRKNNSLGDLQLLFNENEPLENKIIIEVMFKKMTKMNFDDSKTGKNGKF